MAQVYFDSFQTLCYTGHSTNPLEVSNADPVSYTHLSAPNGVVMDLFGGSGSTLMACEQTDRICRTMELDPRYASVIVERFLLHEAGDASRIRCLRDGRELTYGEALQAAKPDEAQDGRQPTKKTRPPLCGRGRRVRCLFPVSSTHLDVYKRQ